MLSLCCGSGAAFSLRLLSGIPKLLAIFTPLFQHLSLEKDRHEYPLQTAAFLQAFRKEILQHFKHQLSQIKGLLYKLRGPFDRASLP
jgi:hypothetical protein